MRMAYRSQADWDSVDWSRSDRDLALLLGVTHAAVSKRRKKLGHASDYKVDVTLLRGWFEHNRARLPGMSTRDIQVEVYDQLNQMIETGSVRFWRKEMSPRPDEQNLLGHDVAGVASHALR